MSLPINNQWAEASSRNLSAGPSSPTQAPSSSTVPPRSAPVFPFTLLSSAPKAIPRTNPYIIPPVVARIGASCSPSPLPAASPIAPPPPNHVEAFLPNPSAAAGLDPLRSLSIFAAALRPQPPIRFDFRSPANLPAASPMATYPPNRSEAFSPTPPSAAGSGPLSVVAAPLQPQPPIRFNPPYPPPAPQTNHLTSLSMSMPAHSSFMPSCAPRVPINRSPLDTAVYGVPPPLHRPFQPSPTPRSLLGPQVPAAPTGASPLLPLSLLRQLHAHPVPALRPLTIPPTLSSPQHGQEVPGPASEGNCFNSPEVSISHLLGAPSAFPGQELAQHGFSAPAEAPGGEPVVKVAARSNIHTLAGAVAKRLRAGSWVQMVAIGPDSVNQAVKAIAVTRMYLEDDPIDLVAIPEFSRVTAEEDNQVRSALQVMIVAVPNLQVKGAIRDQLPTADPSTSQLKVAGNSTVASTAGAIAKRIRVGGRCAAIAMGADPVNQTVKAIALARIFLKRDGLDLAFQPKFIHLSVGDDETRTGLEMVIKGR